MRKRERSRHKKWIAPASSTMRTKLSAPAEQSAAPAVRRSAIAVKQMILSYGEALTALLFAIALTAGSAGMRQTVYGNIAGSGTQQDPVRGNAEISAGETIAPGLWIRGLTAVHGREISLRALYEAREYELLFHASGGNIPGIGEKSLQRVRYNDGSGATSSRIQLPGTPVREGYAFAGWYLKGNNSLDGSMIKNGSRYMIAVEDAADRSRAEIDGNAAVARAVWKKYTVTEPEDGNGPDYPPGTENPKDPWGKTHSRNHVIEYREEVPTRQQYRRKYGQTAYQYGRILFDAETNAASSYRWYVDGRQQTEGGAQFQLSEIKRELNGAEVKCIVTLNDNQTTLEYKTNITVYHLPEIRDTEFQYQML